MKRNRLFSLIILLSIPLLLGGQMEHQEYYPETDPLVLKKLEEWQDIKFGLMMHWGTYSQWGVVESWTLCGEDEPWCQRPYDDYNLYKREYKNLQTTFNPVDFDPEKWAEAAKKAGMRYLVFTTKHHDGFCLFDTKLTDYKITDPKTPFHTHPRANITKEIFDAFREKGFKIGAYFSKPDWNHPDYWWPRFPTADRNVNYDVLRYPERWERFVQFTHGQIDELMTGYGRIDILWLDGGWVRPYTAEEIREYKSRPGFKQPNLQSQDIRMDEIVKNARAKQPGLIVADRAVEGPFQNYLTPENRVPEDMIPYPWESNLVSGGGYSYVPNAKYMSSRKVVQMLVDIVAKGGNLILNIAPSPLGDFDPAAYEMLDGVADWMDTNSEAIYDTRPIGPYKDGKIALTQNRHTKTVYAVYLPDEDESIPPKKIWLNFFQLPLKARLSLLGASGSLSWETVGKGCLIHIPEKTRKELVGQAAWVVKISTIEH